MKIIAPLASILLLVLFNQVAYGNLSSHQVSDQAFSGVINGVSFQQDAITSYKGYQYAVYWSASRHIAVARRKHGEETWETAELRDYQFATDNDHYDISLGLSPSDGTLHLSFYQWSSIFNYRKSVPGILDTPEEVTWNANLFGPVQNGLMGPTMQPTTYPRFVTQPSGDLLLLLRHGESGAGDSYLYEYEGAKGTWQGLGKLVDGLSTNINAYFNGLHYDGQGRLHASWVWRATPDATTNFNLHYIYSDDDGRTWHNNSGQHIATTGQQPITQNSPGIAVWQIGQNRGLINQEAQAVDQDGRVSMLMSHLPDSAPSSSNFDENRHIARVFHYLRDTNGQWSRQMLPGATYSYDRNKIAADSAGNLYAVINNDGIYKATIDNRWHDWSLLQSLNDQTFIEETQLDRQHLIDSDVLSVLQFTRQNQLLLLEYAPSTTSLPQTDTGGGPIGFRFCAQEGEICQAPQGADVAYGAAGQFFHRVGGGSVSCNGATFGDPIRGTVKRCYYATGSGTPKGYSICAEEHQLCSVEGLTQVAFGANGAFHYRLTEQDINCATSEFGDPLNSVAKQCFIYPIDQQAPVSSSTSSSSSQSSQAVSLSSSSQSSAAGSTTTGGALSTTHLLGVLTTLAIFRRRQKIVIK